jgi:hypothetical protein
MLQSFEQGFKASKDAGPDDCPRQEDHGQAGVRDQRLAERSAPGHEDSPGGGRGGLLEVEIAQPALGYRVEEVFLVADVAVDGHHPAAQAPGETRHAQRLEAFRVGQSEGFLDHEIP